MVTLSSAHDYVILFAIAALFGAIGGLAYELLQSRSNETGSLSLPWHRGWRLFHLGFISSMILGAVAAVAISYFFTPEAQVKDVVNGVAVIKTKWQIAKVVPLSLIVGSAGGAFLAAMQSRLLGELNAQKVATTQAAGKAAVAQVALAAKAVAAGTNARAPILSSTSGAIADAAAEVPESLKVDLAPLIADAPRRIEIGQLLDSFKQAEPLTVHMNRVSTSIDDAVANAARTASDVIDQNVQSAYAAIDAAATATPS